MAEPSHPARYHWTILALAALTNALAVAMPAMCMPVLFKEISGELKLDLVQVGLVWGASALPGIFTGLLGGSIGDRFGPRRVLILGCLFTGVAGALRGLSFDFWTLVLSMFMVGALSPFLSMNVFKTCGLWFPRSRLGLANGVLSMGMALGFLVGSLISATLLSPWLNGWRNVLFLYGAVAALLCIPWYFARRDPEPIQSPAPGAAPVSVTGVTPAPSIHQSLRQVVGLRNIWLLGLTIFGVSGCVQGTLGYLPLYLRALGWTPASADGALSAFHTLSMLFVIPIALWSDRFGSRKKLLLAAALMIVCGVSLLSVANGWMIWVAVGIAGMVRDGFMGMFMTQIIETEGVGPRYAGTATGFVMIFSGLANLVAPPLGNSLASIAPSLPFVFWAVLLIGGIAGLAFTREYHFDNRRRPELVVGGK